MHENAFNNDELRGLVTQSSGVRLTTEMTAAQEFEPHAAERVQMLAAMNAEGANGELEGGGVIKNEECDMLHRGALDIECRDTEYRESASAAEFLLPEMFSTVMRYVETRRDNLRSFGARFFAVDNH